MAAQKRSKPPPVAVIYLRVSTAQQSTIGVGLESQEAACRQHAARLGLPVVSVHQDAGISGRDGLEERPGLAAALAAVRDTPGAVLVAYSLSRLARRQRLVWHILDDKGGLGVPFTSATESFDTSTPMGRAMLGMLATWAALEADLAGERTRAALAYVKAQGGRLGGLRMAEVRDPDGSRRVDPAKGAILLQVREMYATGDYSHRTLAAELNARGVPTCTGKGQWWAKTVRTALEATCDPQ